MTNRVLLVLALAVTTARAQAPSAADHVAAGQRAFDKGRYSEALAEYQEAFNIESTPENALRMAIAAGYAVDLSNVSKTLDIWLVKKREDAKLHGDVEASWKMVDSLAKAFRYATTQKDKQINQKDQQIQELNRKVADLERKLSDQQIIVAGLQQNFDKQLNAVRRDYEGRMDKLREAASHDMHAPPPDR